MGRMTGFEPARDGATIRCVNRFTTFAIMAGAVGIEPTLTVLETGVLPLYDAPRLKYYIKFLLLLQAIDLLKVFKQKTKKKILVLVFAFKSLTMCY